MLDTLPVRSELGSVAWQERAPSSRAIAIVRLTDSPSAILPEVPRLTMNSTDLPSRLPRQILVLSHNTRRESDLPQGWDLLRPRDIADARPRRAYRRERR